MLTILQVLEATEGGTRRHLRELVDALPPEHVHCVLAVSAARDPDFQVDLAGFRARGVEVAEVPMRRGVAPFADLRSLARLVGLVQRTRPQLIHAHSAKAGFLARLAGAYCRVPVVYTPHGLPFLMRVGAIARRLYWLLERGVAAHTASFIAVSSEEKAAALALGVPQRQIYLIPNGIVQDAGAPAHVHAGAPLRVGFFGRLSFQKGPELLLAAAREVLPHLPSVKFEFHGAGERLDRLQAAVAREGLSHAVLFHGAYAQSEVLERMRQVDIVVVPSRWEGCPYVVLEAFMAGVPVVASAVGGIKDLIQSGSNGLLVPPDDAEALGDALLSLLRDAPLRHGLAKQARTDVAGYTLDAMVAAVAKVYLNVLKLNGAWELA